MGLIKLIKSYKELGREEFWKRTKEGYNQITPAQLAKGELNGMLIVLIGITLGMIITPIIRIQGIWYWAELILVGSFIIAIFQLIGKYQTYKQLKKQDELMKQYLSYDNGEIKVSKDGL